MISVMRLEIDMFNRNFVVQIQRKEEFQRLDGVHEFTGRILNEWRNFSTYDAAQKASREALSDNRVVSATVVTPQYYIVDDFCF